MSLRRTPLPGRPVRNRSRVDPGEEKTQGAALTAATIVVATIVVGQLWGLTVALEAWLDHATSTVKWALLFEAISFVVAFGIWLAAPKGR